MSSPSRLTQSKPSATRWRPIAIAVCAIGLAACGSSGGDGESDDESGGVDITSPVPPLESHAVIAWNDLGMHCVDGKDYSVFSILPPYNNLHAQVVRRDVMGNKLVTSGISLTYEAVADAAGSINTSSYRKTNFWSWAQQLFGASPANDVGLTGNPTPTRAPAAMTYSAAENGWQANGIPVTPYDDAGAKNFYPMVKVVARDAAGQVLASTSVVLPVSDEMSCKGCHASTSGDDAARPAAGWVNDAVDPEKDWKKNILRLHDDKVPGAIAIAGKQASYSHATLLASAEAGQPILCAACHQSNALGTPQVGRIPPLTTAVHARHANVIDPVTHAALEADTTRSACYQCHPGSVTKCLRGVMGNATDANGKPLIDCQSCHGPMSSVARSGRAGWLDEPTCQNCHDRAAAGGAFTRFTSVFASGTTPRATIDRLFATRDNVPTAGKSLYRASTGHGGLQCEACHGSTHAEYPSSHANDNVQSIALQGHVGTLRECGTCHATAPGNGVNGGPHGMHVIGRDWVSQHQHVGWSAACAVCHGSDARGTFLSQTATGQVVGCYSCHNGPRGGD
jgi:hypothetical protein